MLQNLYILTECIVIQIDMLSIVMIYFELIYLTNLRIDFKWWFLEYRIRRSWQPICFVSSARFGVCITAFATGMIRIDSGCILSRLILRGGKLQIAEIKN